MDVGKETEKVEDEVKDEEEEEGERKERWMLLERQRRWRTKWRMG